MTWPGSPSGGGDTVADERKALFDQPYIDPLTDYLVKHRGDAARAPALESIREERDRRCKTIAGQYASVPATAEVLAKYKANYGHSCPQQVAVFQARVARENPQQAPVSDQALSDCYLLTAIRNFSAAREACLEPAEDGDVRSQANMALIAHAFEDYPSALQWAEKAAAASADAAFLLGQMYANGRGVSQDMEQATYWYRKAAQQGHKEATEELAGPADEVPADDV